MLRTSDWIDTRRRHEAVIEAFKADTGLRTRLVQYVDTVTPAMTARNALGLSIHTHSKVAQLSELTHGRLGTGEGAHAHTEG